MTRDEGEPTCEVWGQIALVTRSGQKVEALQVLSTGVALKEEVQPLWFEHKSRLTTVFLEIQLNKTWEYRFYNGTELVAGLSMFADSCASGTSHTDLNRRHQRQSHHVLALN